MSSIIEHPIRVLSAGLDDERAVGYAICRFPNGLWSLLRLDLEEAGEYADWMPCAHAWSEDVLQGSIYRWTGLSVPLWQIRGENRTEAT